MKTDPFEIYGLSIPQPYASLLTYNVARPGARQRRFAKHYLVLPYATDWRGPVVLHADKADPGDFLRSCSSLRQLRAIGEALLPILYTDGVPEDKTWQDVILMLDQLPGILPRKAILARARLKACHLIDEDFLAKLSDKEAALDNFTPGAYAWEFADRAPTVPITHNGGQRLWRYT